MNRPSIIHKDAAQQRLLPNWTDYAEERSRFTWEQARLSLQGLPGGGLNMGFEAVDRHAASTLRYHAALRFVSNDRPTLELNYADLARQTNRFANVLQSLGVGKGDRLFLLAGRIPELYIALLGALKNGTVVTPLFSAFGPEPIATRIQLGVGQVLVTTDALYQRKVRQVRAQMPSLRHIPLVAEDGGSTHEPDTLDLAALMTEASGSFETVATTEDDPALLHFTSGTTGTLKGALHVHGAAVAHLATAPTAIRMLMKADPDLAKRQCYPCLRFIASVGEPLNPEAVWWGQQALGLPIHDNWWQTETGGIMIASTPAFDIKPGSMGRPLPGIDAFIVENLEA